MKSRSRGCNQSISGQTTLTQHFGKTKRPFTSPEAKRRKLFSNKPGLSPLEQGESCAQLKEGIFYPQKCKLVTVSEPPKSSKNESQPVVNGPLNPENISLTDGDNTSTRRPKRRLTFEELEPNTAEKTPSLPISPLVTGNDIRRVNAQENSSVGRTFVVPTREEVSAESKSSQKVPEKSQLKHELKKVTNLKELRAKLCKFNNEIASLNENRKKLSVEASPDPQTVSNGTGSATNSPLKESVAAPEAPMTAAGSVERDLGQLPAHVRLKHFVLPDQLPLPLPPKHGLLCSFFETTDHLVSMMYNRMETVTWLRLREGVQALIKRNYKLKHLAQIKHVYPEAYTFSQEQVPVYGQPHGTHKYQLKIVPCLESDLINFTIPELADNCIDPNTSDLDSKNNKDSSVPTRSPSKTPEKILPSTFRAAGTPVKNLEDRGGAPSAVAVAPDSTVRRALTFSPRKDGRRCMTPQQLALRKELFRYRVLQTVKKHHQEFLLSLKPPVALTDSETSRMTRWHPRFRLETVPEIPEDSLPEAPAEQILTSAEDALEKMFDRFPTVSPTKVSEKLRHQKAKREQKDALERQENSQDAHCRTLASPAAQKPTVQPNKGLRGIDIALLEKIRQKQADKDIRRMLETDQETVRKRQLTYLPTMIRTINTFFHTKHCKPQLRSLIFKAILADSPMSDKEVGTRFSLLLEVAKDWIEQFTVASSAEPYVRVRPRAYGPTLNKARLDAKNSIL